MIKACSTIGWRCFNAWCENYSLVPEALGARHRFRSQMSRAKVCKVFGILGLPMFYGVDELSNVMSNMLSSFH